MARLPIVQGQVPALARRHAVSGDHGYAAALEHQEAGRFKQAAEVMRTWLAAHPEDAAAHAQLAHALSLDKQEDAA